jgi:hypothetical protein
MQKLGTNQASTNAEHFSVSRQILIYNRNPSMACFPLEILLGDCFSSFVFGRPSVSSLILCPVPSALPLFRYLPCLADVYHYPLVLLLAQSALALIWMPVFNEVSSCFLTWRFGAEAVWPRTT